METTGGKWLAKEIAECEHIDCLELKAAKLGLLSLCEKEEHVDIRLQLYNLTTVTFIDNMGGTHSTACNKVAQDISLWCIETKMYLWIYKLLGLAEISG